MTLVQRLGVWDFKYARTYLHDYVIEKNEPGLERHAFPHLDCPHSSHTRSGRFILAKFAENKEETELHITAFIIPRKHTLYIPPYAIHSNDYLQGTWRTMLSGDDIDRVVMKRNRYEINFPETFTFAFPSEFS